MCGICGFTGSSNRELIKSMLSLIWKRGPDEEGVFLDHAITMGIRRLSIVDVETGRQPISNEDYSVTTIFNGEIYNYVELRNELIARGHNFRTNHSDTECIVHAYEEYGIDFIHRLNGMFAIALWDSKKQTLHLIRDRMGVKPLYYCCIGRNIIFASEIKCILAHPEVARTPDYNALRMFFAFRHIPAPMTAFKGIESLQQGERLEYTAGQCKKMTYYSISLAHEHEEDIDNAKSHLIDLLTDAVKIRMRADVPVGAFLSGGLDSSSVVSLMETMGAGNIHTFNLGYFDSFAHKDEDVKCASMIAKKFDITHHEYKMGIDELVIALNAIIEAFDEPFTGVFSTFFLSKHIATYLKVALSGDGADELFGGYTSALIATPLEEIARSGSIETPEKYSHHLTSDFIKEVWDAAKGDLAATRYYLYTRGQFLDCFTEEFQDRVRKDTHPREYFTAAYNTRTHGSFLNYMLYIDWTSYLPDQVLKFVDRLSMAHSLEIRSPYLDYRLVEYMFSLGPKTKMGLQNEPKHLLKQTLKGTLPDKIVNRKKEGFVLPITEWFARTDFFMYVKSVLDQSRIRRYGILRSTVVDALVSQQEKGAANNTMVLWNMTIFQLWLERYFPLQIYS